MSGLNDRDAAALTYLAMRIRAETYGAGAWDEPGTASMIAKLRGRSLALTTEHIIRNAADLKAKTPGVLLGAYTPSAPPADTSRRHPRPEEACKTCGGWDGHCPCRATEGREVDDDLPSPDLPPVTDANPRLAERLRARTQETA